MIPTSFLSRLSLPSPQQTERDLARLIHRTIELDRRANRQLGYAAVNIGCDGVRRVTMFDGSSCQTSGDVCLATREEGITVCLDTPSGAGLAFQRIAFDTPACEPVTGWWLVDAEGYMYRVPASLVAAAPYWPMSADPAVPAPAVTLVRSGTWAALMCGAGIEIPLQDGGGAEWNQFSEGGDWNQRFYAAVGGELTEITTVPTITAPYEPNEITVADGVGTLNGATGEAISLLHWLNGRDADGVEIGVGEECCALVTWGESEIGDVSVTLGARAAIGAAEYPFPRPIGSIVLARLRFQRGTTGPERYEYGVHAGDLVLAVAIEPVAVVGDWVRRIDLSVESSRGVLLRDRITPNAGSRWADVTLPTAGTGIMSGVVRVCYGYAFGAEDTGVYRAADTLKPYTRPETLGVWESDCAGRVLGDMALAYRRGLAVSYGGTHVCLDGDAIASVSDFVDLDEIDETDGPAHDVGAGVVGLPGGEVAVLGTGSTHDLRTGKRYRVRPAPDTALTVEVEHRAKGAWGDDPNEWTAETTYDVGAWGAGSTVTVGADALSATLAPGRAVACVLWETDDPADTYETAPVTYECLLGPTVAGVTTLLDMLGDPATLAPSTLTDRWLTILGPVTLCLAYGWTAVVLEDPDDAGSPTHETALSPLAVVGTAYQVAGIGGQTWPEPTPLFSVKLTIPTGPDGTVEYRVYRWTWDAGRTDPLTGLYLSPPWAYADFATPLVGGLYDRHLRLVATSAVPGVIYDDDTTLVNLGTRPPSPLVYLGPIVLDAPRPVHVLQPMEL